MEDAVAMHMVNRFHQLVDVKFNSVLWEIVRAAFDRLVHIHVHELKDKGKPARGLVVQDFEQVDDMRMRGEAFESLDLPQLLHLLQRVEVVLHAFDCDILSTSDRLRLQNF